MRIKLIFPTRELRDTETIIKNHLVPSETLTAIAAATPPHHEIEIVDENVCPLDLGEVPDLVGITVYTFVAPRAYELARHYRARGAHVVLGGLHVTGAPHDAIPHADTLFIGEAEVLWPTFLADLERGTPRRVYGPDFPSDLDALPLPRKALLDRRRYLTTASVSGSRGCPHRCRYCFNSVEPKSPFRHRSVESIIDQIARDGDDYVIFFDDNLTVNRRFALHLCAELGKLRVRWRCAASIDLGYDEELVREMARDGCDAIFIGFESVNPGSMSESAKFHNRTGDYAEVIRVFQGNGILINAAFVFGFDHDGPGVFRDTIDFAIANRLTSVNFHILTPFPGTPLFARLEAEGRVLTRDWARYDTGHVVFQPKQMTPEQLLEGIRWAYGEFYSWRSILRRLPARHPQYALRSLIFNLALKKVDWLWCILRRAGLLYQAFHLYHTLSGLSAASLRVLRSAPAFGRQEHPEPTRSAGAHPAVLV